MKHLMFALVITLSGCADRYDAGKTQEVLDRVLVINTQNKINIDCMSAVLHSLKGGQTKSRQTIRTFLGLPKNYTISNELFSAYWDAYVYRCEQKAWEKLEREKL